MIGTICFALAVIHTFASNAFNTLARRFPEGSTRKNLFHFLGEVEVVFGLWAGVFIVFYIFTKGFAQGLSYLESIDFTEPAFVFVIMCIAGTRPIVSFAEKVILWVAQVLPFSKKMSFYISSLILGPLLGSFITEPAAMTVTGLILLKFFYREGGARGETMSKAFQYATLGLLFVNISIGGTLTPFAAPPVLIVAEKYGWDVSFMFSSFGYKAAISVIVGTLLTAFFFRRELAGELVEEGHGEGGKRTPRWILLLHIFFLFMVIKTAHHSVFFMALFLFFLGFATVTDEYQDKLKIKESLLVGLFLAGLVTLGKIQAWWLQETLASLGDLSLFFGATGLTMMTDNAALTYLGSLVELSESAKYNLVAGAVAGGGLTVIANAPNPAGFGLLKHSFGPDGINPFGLFLGALFPTALICALFQLLPSLWSPS